MTTKHVDTNHQEDNRLSTYSQCPVDSVTLALEPLGALLEHLEEVTLQTSSPKIWGCASAALALYKQAHEEIKAALDPLNPIMTECYSFSEKNRKAGLAG